MKLHEMGLQDKWFDAIVYGTKRFELRLFDEKRRQVRLGDKIRFKSVNGRTTTRTVSAIVRAKTFKDIFNLLPIELLASKDISKEEMLSIMEQFYPVEKQRSTGVVAIGLK